MKLFKIKQGSISHLRRYHRNQARELFKLSKYVISVNEEVYDKNWEKFDMAITIGNRIGKQIGCCTAVKTRKYIQVFNYSSLIAILPRIDIKLYLMDLNKIIKLAGCEETKGYLIQWKEYLKEVTK